MVGEGLENDEDETYPRSFKNKTVGQRMVIISAGVIMNVLLGAVCFVAVYRLHGMEDTRASLAPASRLREIVLDSAARVDRLDPVTYVPRYNSHGESQAVTIRHFLFSAPPAYGVQSCPTVPPT